MRIPLRSILRATAALGLALVASAWSAAPASAQRIIKTPDQLISLLKGASALFMNPSTIQRYSIGDPTIAEATVVTPTEILLNGKALGTTTLLVWDAGGQVKLYSVEVTPDASGLQRYLAAVLPKDSIAVSTNGSVITLSGAVRNASAADQALAIAKATGDKVTVVDNMVMPTATQVLLRVRFAEVTKSALKQFSAQFQTLNPHQLSDKGNWQGFVNTDPKTGGRSDGVLDLGLFSGNASIEGLVRAMQQKGDLRSLAEPNLVTLPGKAASFLAGGEFPYPSVQSSGGGNNVTITFKEFGIRLNFLPTITRNGAIRLHIAPEVSSLDFANALVFGGFTVPALITRKAETDVEMQPGQFLAIAGLMSNALTDNVSKIPILGDIPILGQFFRSNDARQSRTQLLVLVQPELIQPSDSAEAIPTGEPASWPWTGYLKKTPAEMDGVVKH